MNAEKINPANASAAQPIFSRVASDAANREEGTGLNIVADATCPACSCSCDDLIVKSDGRTVVEAVNACTLGRGWFLAERSSDAPAVQVDGRAASLEAAIDRAARLLLDAKYPLVYGLHESTTEAQRAACAVADWIGAVIDTPTSRQGPTGVTFRGTGMVTATLGEVRHRSDFVLFWRTDPVVTHPRHLLRYSLLPEGQFLPGGRRDRYAVAVDERPTRTGAACDEQITVGPDADFAAIGTLRAVLKGLPVDGDATRRETGTDLSTWRALAERMKQARYGVVFYGDELWRGSGRHVNVEALLTLVRELNAHTRFVSLAMRSGGNALGADDVLAWRTGFPFAVNFARGYPRFEPNDYAAANVLARREADAALLVGRSATDELSPPARDHLYKLPRIVVGSHLDTTAEGAAVSIRTAPVGIAVGGTIYRQDDVPLALRPAVESPLPSEFDVLSRLEKRILELRPEIGEV